MENIKQASVAITGDDEMCRLMSAAQVISIDYWNIISPKQ